MSASEAKKAKRRKKGNCLSLSGAIQNKASLTVNWVSHENPANLQDQAISEMQKLMDAEDDLPKTVIPRGPNPYLGVEQCLLCHRIRSNPPSPEPHRKCDGTDDGSKLMSDTATLAQLPLWVCADCRHSVEDDPRKDCSDTGILASGLFLQPTPLDIISCIQQPSGSESSSSSCEACSRKRDSEQEQEATHLQADWMELHYAVWQIYRKAGVGDGCEDAGIDDPDQQLAEHLSMERVAELVNRLCIMDPHQLFQRLETQAHEAVIDSKMHLLRLLPPSAATKTPNTHAAANFVQALLEDYAKLCVACMQLCPLLRQLESEHLKKFNLTWELVNQHLFQSIVHTDPLIQKSLPALIAHLRNVAALQDSNSQDSLASTLYHRYVKFNDEMTMISAVWRREAEHYIQEYNAEQLALKAKQRMLQEDWELFRMQRKLLEQQLQKDGASLPGDCSPGFAETMQQMLSGAKALSDDCHCPHCNRNQCPCDECSISHMLTCGLITPPDTPVPGEDLILSSPPQLTHEAAQFLHPALTAIVATTERVLDGAMCANGFDHKLGSSSAGSATALPWEMDEEDDDEEEEDEEDDDDDEDDEDEEDDDDEDEEEEDDEDDPMQATELQNGSHVERSENCHGTAVRSSELQDTPASPASPSPTPEDGVSQGQGLSDGANVVQSCECHVCTAPVNGSSLPVNVALQDNLAERPCECNTSLQHHHHHHHHHGERSGMSTATTPPLRPLSLHLYPHIHGGINTSTSQLLHTPPSAALKSLIHPHLYNLHPASMMLTPSSSSAKHRNGSTPSTPTTSTVITTESDITTAGVQANAAAAGSPAAVVPSSPFSLDLNPTAAVAFQEQLYRTYGDWDNAYESTKMLLNARKYAAASPNVLSTSQGHVPGALVSSDLYQAVVANVSSELPIVSSVALDTHLPPTTLRPNLNGSTVSLSSCAGSSAEALNESVESCDEAIKDACRNVSLENHSSGAISSSACSVANHTADLPTNSVKGNLCAKHAHAASASSSPYPSNLLPSPSSSNSSSVSVASSATAAKRNQTTSSMTSPVIPSSCAVPAKELASVSAPPSVSCCNNSNGTVRLPPSSTKLSTVQHTCGLPNTTANQPSGQQHDSPPLSAKPQIAFDGVVDQLPQAPSTAASNDVCADPECYGHHGDADDSIDDSCSEQSSSTSTSNQKDSKHCDCCYCEVFGHGTPTVAPVSKNYIEMRERLRLRLTKRKSKCKNANNSSSSPTAAAPAPAPVPPVPAPAVVVPAAPVVVPPPVAPTSISAKTVSPESPVTVPQQDASWPQLQTVEDVDALVNFINGTEAGGREKGLSNKAAKRARQKQRKAEEKARKQGDGIENTPETAEDANTIRKSKSATTLGEHKPDNQQQTVSDKQQQTKGKPRIVSLESIMEEMRKGDLAGKGTNDSILQRVIEAVKAGTAASSCSGSSGSSSDNSEPSSSSSSISSSSSSGAPNDSNLSNNNNSNKSTGVSSADGNVVNSKWELSLQSFMAAAGQAGLEIVPIPAPSPQQASAASLKVTRNPKVSTDVNLSDNSKEGAQSRGDINSSSKGSPAPKAVKKKKKNGNSSVNVNGVLPDNSVAAPATVIVEPPSNKVNKACAPPPILATSVVPTPASRKQPTVIIANGKAAGGAASLNKATTPSVVTITAPKPETKSKKPMVEIIPINGSVPLATAKVNGNRGNVLSKVSGASSAVSVIVSASAANISQAKMQPCTTTATTPATTAVTTSANTVTSKKKKKPQAANGHTNGHNAPSPQQGDVATTLPAAPSLSKGPAVHLVAKSPSVSLTSTTKGKDCPVTVISITSGQSSKKVSATVAVKTVSSAKTGNNGGTNGLPNHIRESPVSFQPSPPQQQKPSRQKAKKDEKNRAEMGSTRKEAPVPVQPQTTVVVQSSIKETKNKSCNGDIERTVCNGNGSETTVIVVGNGGRISSVKSANVERSAPAATKPTANNVASTTSVLASTTPTSTPALTLRSKKNRKKRGSLDNFNSIDEVFVPRDIDLENGELDETERELEAFKRFCWNSIPLARKEKVHVNLKDIVIKKKSSSMVGCS